MEQGEKKDACPQGTLRVTVEKKRREENQRVRQRLRVFSQRKGHILKTDIKIEKKLRKKGGKR